MLSNLLPGLCQAFGEGNKPNYSGRVVCYIRVEDYLRNNVRKAKEHVQK